MKIYIAGPYTQGDVAINVANAIRAGDQVRSLGHTPYIPHLTHFWHLLCPHAKAFWYAYDDEWLGLCDAVLRLPGESVGADAEVAMMHGKGKPIFYSLEEIPNAEERP